MEFPEEAFLSVGQSLSSVDLSLQDLNTEPLTETVGEKMADNVLQSTDGEKDGTNIQTPDSSNSTRDHSENQMMNSAILVRADLDDDQHDAHSMDKDSFTYSMTTPSGHDQETESVVTTDTSENDNDDISDEDSHVPPLEPCEKRNLGNAELLLLAATNDEEEKVPDLVENFLEPSPVKSPLCDYSVYEQPQLQPQPPKCVYKQESTSLSLLQGGAWWDIIHGRHTQPADR